MLIREFGKSKSQSDLIQAKVSQDQGICATVVYIGYNSHTSAIFKINSLALSFPLTSENNNLI